MQKINEFKEYLLEEEKSYSTIEKYVRDVSAFISWAQGAELSKEIVLEYKKQLQENYLPRSVNSILSSLNAFFEYLDRHDLKVKTIKMQKRIFVEKEKELTQAEYERLLDSAKNKKNERLYYLMQTICSTGIRVSELEYITVEAVKNGNALIDCKGKIRVVLLPKKLCKMLKDYIKAQNIKSGSVFITRNGEPLNRTNIWSDMKKLCEAAKVDKNKVFPHNLRHLFARTYYTVNKDIVRLADILGHSSIDTTRIYTIESGEIHRMQIEKMHLLRC